VIRIVDLHKSFGSRVVLDGLNLEVAEGQILFILGTSGTGKSVLLKNLVGLMKPTSGEIWIDDEEITQFTERELFPVRRRCGMVFQQPALFDSLTVYENIAFGLRKNQPDLPEAQVEDRVRECLNLVHLQDVDQKKPPQISYGMQKRVSLARTVAVRPKVLLFDEPTTGLDPVTTNAINELIEELSRTLGTTSLVVSHDMHCALDIADSIVVLDQGKIAAQGTPDELKKSDHPLVRDFLSEAMYARPGT
jgi:phospholipid/cholesterol/gamma-HCH transport system ATP-binding protein